MEVLKFDDTDNSLYPYVLEFKYPNLENLDNILDDLVSQIPEYVKIKGSNDLLEVAYADFDKRISPFNEELYLWLNQCLAESAEFFFPYKPVKLSICDGWLTRSKSLKSSEWHYHSASVTTGIVYFSTNKSNTHLRALPNNFPVLEPYLRNKAEEYAKHMIIPSEKGKLVIFDSSIFHMAKVYNVADFRYTYAFNSYPTNIVSNGSTSFLEYHVKDIKARYLEYKSSILNKTL